jgi:hypothetical protein
MADSNINKYNDPASIISRGKLFNELVTNNYIYISHLGEGYQYWRLPTEPDSIADTLGSTFTQTTALGRSAPIFTYSSSGPRSIQVTLNLHRDMMDDINMSNVSPFVVQAYKDTEKLDADGNPTTKLVALQAFPQDRSEDYTDTLIRALQSIALPHYSDVNNTVEPPIVALRFGDEIFIRGIVDSGITVTYEKPILSNNKYAQVTIAFTVYEIDPYDAQAIFNNGSFRGVVATMKAGMGLNG